MSNLGIINSRRFKEKIFKTSENFTEVRMDSPNVKKNVAQNSLYILQTYISSVKSERLEH